MAQIKPDLDPVYIKPDPDNKDIVLADLEDDDIYEDAGDLDFSASAQNVWLTRLPQQLWDHWATTDENADDDEEIEIGTIRIEGDPGDMKRVCITNVQKSSALGYSSLFALSRSAYGCIGEKEMKIFPRTTLCKSSQCPRMRHT